MKINTNKGLVDITVEQLQNLVECGKAQPDQKSITLDSGQSWVTVQTVLSKMQRGPRFATSIGRIGRLMSWCLTNIWKTVSICLGLMIAVLLLRWPGNHAQLRSESVAKKSDVSEGTSLPTTDPLIGRWIPTYNCVGNLPITYQVVMWVADQYGVTDAMGQKHPYSAVVHSNGCTFLKLDDLGKIWILMPYGPGEYALGTTDSQGNDTQAVCRLRVD